MLTASWLRLGKVGTHMGSPPHAGAAPSAMVFFTPKPSRVLALLRSVEGDKRRRARGLLLVGFDISRSSTL